jgi:hypothetical protein
LEALIELQNFEKAARNIVLKEFYNGLFHVVPEREKSGKKPYFCSFLTDIDRIRNKKESVF